VIDCFLFNVITLRITEESRDLDTQPITEQTMKKSQC